MAYKWYLLVTSFFPILTIIIIIPYRQHRAMGALSPLDPSSYSRPEISIIKHAKLSWNIDFSKKILSGWVDLNIDIIQKTNELILDIGNQTIKSVKLEDGSSLEYKIDGLVPSFGSKLTITLPKANPEQSTVTVSCVTLKSKRKSNENKSSSKLTVDPTNNVSSADSTPCSCEDSITAKSTIKVSILVSLPCSCEGSITAESTIEVSSMDSLPCSCEDSITAEPVNVTSVDSTSCSCEDGKKKPICHCCACASDKLESIKYDGNRIKIRINYETDPSASALQWLEPSQTSGKKHPYMFSQCQPIHARTIMPCQDTPAVKFTYEAEVTAPPEFTVLMSALRQQCTDNITTFRQPVPIPSYLLAIAVGALESRSLGPRSLIWTEKEEIERSAWEFAETEKYLQGAEKLCGPYVWTQYDLLVLPPSFPYGGMENPCLTFVTPTLLAGDRSQADVIVHEIMHSWTGNLITNRNFEHFWLNEGFTVFLERKVGAALINDKDESKRSRDFHSLLGLLELKEAINTIGDSNPLTNLITNLSSIHPDDSFSRVPYEKGSLFLRYLEDLSGGPDVFDEFLRSYLNNFKMKSIDTNQFKEYLLGYFKNDANASKHLNNVDWDSWLNKSGMPPIIPEYDTSMNKAVTSLVNRIMEGAKLSSSDVKDFSPHQKISLLQELLEKPPLSIDKLKTLGREYNIDNSKNSEIVYRWLRLCIRSKDMEKLKEIFDFINQQGRMKYIRPIYRDLYTWEEVRQQAIDNFLINEKNMMHVSAYTVRKDLHLSQTEK